MKPAWKIAIVAALLLAVGGVLAMKYAGRSTKPSAASRAEASPPRGELPQLLDFGLGKCTQCIIMQGILKEIQRDYPGRLKIEVINIQEDQAAAEVYDIRIIPTQVFLSPDGMELFRNQGLMSKEKIVAKWAELGYDLKRPAAAPAESD